jgi:CRP-like cAMP-binding protein
VLRNRLLAALPPAGYARVVKHLRLKRVVTGDTLHASGARISEVYFPNGGVFSVTNQMRDGALVEVAVIGREGMVGISAFFGNRTAAGRTFQQVPNGPVLSMAVARYIKETDAPPSGRSSACTRRRTSCRSCSAPRATHSTTSGSGVVPGCCRHMIVSMVTTFP